MIKKLFTITAFLVLSSAIKVSAMPARVVYSEDIESSSVELKVTKGHGLTINFTPTGETIKQVWLGDPSRFVFSLNGCSKSDSCENNKPTVLLVRQIKPISFPSVTSSGDGSTSITILTNLKQYQFKLVATSGKPSYTSLVVKSESEKPEPLSLPQQQTPVTVSANPTNNTPQILTVSRTTKPVGTSLQRNNANALAYGLLVAKQKGEIQQNSSLWKRIQTAIALLRKDKTIKESAELSGVQISLIQQLISYGKL